MSNGELARLAATQAGAMMDECELLRRSDDAADAYGMPAPVYTVTGTVACGLEHSQTNNEAGGRERLGTQAQTENRQLRLPAGTDIRSIDRVRITKRFGQPVTPVTYEVIGAPVAGPSGLLVHIQKVTE